MKNKYYCIKYNFLLKTSTKGNNFIIFEQLIKLTINPIGWLDIHRVIGGQNHIRWNSPLLPTSSLLSSLFWLALGIASHWPPLLLFLCRYNVLVLIVYIWISCALVFISLTPEPCTPNWIIFPQVLVCDFRNSRWPCDTCNVPTAIK